ncbi:MAG: MarR family transcriptional regulator [Gammaproteobacteria bacterium]|nr:MarR family transcriptional regulator [Gammaproteobacteria bacterium]
MNAGLKESEDSKRALRAWVQLLKTAKRIESEVASHFANQHNTSLSRFDVLANLERSPGHATGTSQLSKMLLASRGNITRLLDRMENDALIRREPHPGDRRISEVRMTAAGEALFARLAPDHEGWAQEIFGALTEAELDDLIAMLRKLRVRLDEVPKSRPGIARRPEPRQED